MRPAPAMGRPAWVRDVPIVAVLAVLPVFFLREAPGGLPPYGGDILVHVYPLLSLLAHGLHAGRPTLWNYYAAGGYPLAPYGALAFYPPALLALLLLPVTGALAALYALYLAVLGVGTYLLAADLGQGRPARLLAAVTLACGGFVAAHAYAGHIFELGAVCPFPLAYLLLRRAILRRSPALAMWCGAVVGLMVLAAGVQFLPFALAPLPLLALWHSLTALTAPSPASAADGSPLPRQGEGSGVRGVRGVRAALWPLAALGVAALVALALGAVFLLPFAEILPATLRSGAVPPATATAQSLPWGGLVMLAAPDGLGNAAAGTYWPAGRSSPYFHEIYAYAGMLPLLLAPVALARCRRALPYGLLALMALLVMLGGNTPLYGLLYRLPGGGLLRVPARAGLTLDFALALLAGFGLDALLRGGPWVPSRLGIAGFQPAPATGAASALTEALARRHAHPTNSPSSPGAGWKPAIPETIAPGLTGAGEGSRWRAAGWRRALAPFVPLAPGAAVVLVALLALLVTAALAGRGDGIPVAARALALRGAARLGVSLLIGLAACVALLALHRVPLGGDHTGDAPTGGARAGHIWAFALPALAVLDLFTANGALLRPTDPAAYYKASAGVLAPRDPAYRVLAPDHPAPAVPLGLCMVTRACYDTQDAAPLALDAYWRLSHPSLVRRAGGHVATGRDTAVDVDPFFLRLFGVRTLYSAAPLPAAGLGLRPAGLVTSVRWDVPGGADWNVHTFVARGVVYDNPAALPRTFIAPRALLAHSDADALTLLRRGAVDPRAVAVLSYKQDRPAGLLGGIQGAWADWLAADGDDALTARADGGVRGGYLVVDDGWFPGWTATVDGRAAPVWRADYLLRAVRLPPGRHTVRLVYAPLVYLLGAAVTLAAALALLLLAAVTLVRLLRRPVAVDGRARTKDDKDGASLSLAR